MKKGFKFTQEAKDKLKQDRKNRGMVAWNKGLTSKTDERVKKYGLAERGKFVSLSTRKKIGEARKKFIGELSSNWKGGVSFLKNGIYSSLQYVEWRKSVFERDNYVCKMCGFEKGHKLQAHHIKPVKNIISDNQLKNTLDAFSCSELWDTDNGITLCKRCHELILRKENFWAPIFKELIKNNITLITYE